MSQHHNMDRREEPEGGFGLSDVLSLLRRRWWVIAALTLLITSAAAAVLMMIPNRYDASATVQIDPRKRTIVQLENVISDLRTDTSVVESEVEILKSAPLAMRVIDKLGLRTDSEFAEPGPIGKTMAALGLNTWRLQKSKDQAPEAGAISDAISGLIKGAEKSRANPIHDEVTSQFASRLKIFRVRNSLVIEIRFTAKDPVKAAKIANTVAEVYIQDQLDEKMRATAAATELLENKLEGLRFKLAEDERRVARYKADNNIVDSEGQLLLEKQMARVMEQAVMSRNTTAETNAKYQQVMAIAKQGRDKASMGDVLQSHTIRMLKEQQAKVTRREAELLTRYGPRHPEMLKIQAEVSDIQSQINTEVMQILANLKSDYEVATERERQLTAALNSIKEQQIGTAQASVKLRELEREVQTSKQVFESFLTRFKQTAETQTMQLADSRIIEYADVPLYPSSPKRKQMLMMALVAGLALGLGLAFLQEFMVPGMRRPEEVEQALGAPQIAEVPALERPDGAVLAPQQAVRLVNLEPSGLFAEAIRNARHEIDSVNAMKGPRMILVASSLPGEGKTMIASNLAYHYAASGHRTLLIDGDMRRANLSRTLGITGGMGLYDVLAGEADPLSALLSEPRSGLYVLPSQRAAGPMSPAEALASPALTQVLKRVKEHFDVIIIDGPPLLPVVDGRILADHADQIVMTFVWRKTPKKLAKRAVKSLGANIDKIAGVIANKVARAEMTVNFGYGYGNDKPARPRKAA